MLVLQLFLVLLTVVLDFGPVGRQADPYFNLTSGFVVVWAFSWFGKVEDSFRFAVLQGLAYTIVSFLVPVGWFIAFLGIHFLTVWLKNRFFESSSALLALVTLLIVSIWGSFVTGLSTNSVDSLAIVGSVIANGLVGTFLYYFIGIRFKFLQRWAGRRL